VATGVEVSRDPMGQCDFHSDIPTDLLDSSQVNYQLLGPLKEEKTYDGYCFLGLCFTLRSDEFMRSYCNYKLIECYSSIW
jgi:hypothetical protein